MSRIFCNETLFLLFIVSRRHVENISARKEFMFRIYQNLLFTVALSVARSRGLRR